MSKLPIKAGQKSPAHISPLQMYLQEIARYPLLEPEEELKLARLHFEDGDIPAAHRLITSNLRLVVKIASDFRKAQANLLDLIQEGNYGLMQAVKKYNPYKGVRLSSYAAWWIRAYILKYLLDNKSQVRIATTAAQRKLFYNLQKETDRLLSEYDTVDPGLIAKHLNVPEKDVVEMQKRLQSGDVSLDAPLYPEDASAGTKADLLIDEAQVQTDDFLSDHQLRQIFSKQLEEFRRDLKGRDLEILEKRILSEHPMTLQEIGDLYGISRERARQIEARIIRKLKDFIEKQGVLDISLPPST